jgi:hypothetical protein
VVPKINLSQPQNGSLTREFLRETDRTERAAPDHFGSDFAGLSRNEAVLGLGEHGGDGR